MSRWIELLQGDDGQLSMSRLLTFLSFFPTTYILCTNPSENMLLYYLGAFVVNYLGGKGADAWRGRPANVIVNHGVSDH